jgi:hypothetical protein
LSSNPDSFIDEVTEELRRDRLFAAFRKYGWIGITVILLIVGWSAWLEWSAARNASRAQAFGDAVLQAVQKDDAADRQAALAAVKVETPDQGAVLALLAATTPEAAPQLAALAADPKVAPIYRDLAAFRRLLLLTDMDAAERAAGFEALARPGAPFRMLAEEQLALIDITAGRTDAGIARLKAMAEDTEASGALRRRAQQLIVALGGTPGN